LQQESDEGEEAEGEEAHQDEGEAHRDEEAYEAEEEDGELGGGAGAVPKVYIQGPLGFRIDPYRLRTDRLLNQRDYGNLSQLFHPFCSN
jgi:hypothetical protein